jgi:ADP-ribose pyrophosphatase YjhB (NUDIX family)
MLTNWIPKDEEYKLPEYATHFIGVGGLVLNSKNEILLVKENNSMIKGLYKLPGGFSETGESLLEGCRREVKLSIII